MCRSPEKISSDSKKKISIFCNIPYESVVMSVDVESIYEVPKSLFDEKIEKIIFDHFDLSCKKKINLDIWKNFNKKIKKIKNSIDIAIVGKYINLSESYKSLNEALFHSGVHNNLKVNVSWIDSSKLKDLKSCEEYLSKFNGILVPGGFGKRGAEGKINAIRYAKNSLKPFLGICFGMQLAVIESIRNIKGYENASSSEFSKTKIPVISLIEEWEDGSKVHRQDHKNFGGSMRLGSYKSVLIKNSKISKIYEKLTINERHRHRYEVNINYKNVIKESGVIFSGSSPDGKLAEVMERTDHPWFLGVQYHPELKSTPFNPHPIFNSFTLAILKNKKKEEAA